MNELLNKISNERIVSLKKRDSLRTGTLILMLDAVQQHKIRTQTPTTEADVIQILSKMVAQRNQSIKIYRDAGAEDRAQIESDEIAIINEFLPQQASSEEIELIINEAIIETQAQSIKDMGKVMSIVKEKLAGKADMSTLGALVKERILNV